MPSLETTITDGALGIAPADVSGILAILGISESGSTTEINTYTNVQDIVDAYGAGPMVEAAAHVLAIAGGAVRVVRIAQDSAGVDSAVVQSGAGPLVTLSGDPLDLYDAVITITTAGAIGVAKFTYSLDGGVTTVGPLVTAATYLIPNTGITLNLAAGPYVLDEEYTWTATPPTFTSAEMNTAIDVVTASGLGVGGIFVVGGGLAASDQATLATAFDLKLVAAEAADQFLFGVMEGGVDTDSNIITAFASFSSVYVSVGPSDALLSSSITGFVNLRSVSWPVAARIAKVPISVRPSRTRDGAASGITTLTRDERTTPVLTAELFSTMQTYQGETGSWISAAMIHSSTSSDFQRIEIRRVVNAGADAANRALFVYLDDGFLVDSVTGFIRESEALRIEARVKSFMRDALTRTTPQHASDVDAQVKRDENIISTDNVTVTITITSLGYANSISINVGLKNPALTPA